MFLTHAKLASSYREREINNLVRRADFNNDSYVQEFGLTISNNMMEVRGRVLAPPKLQYGGRVSSISTGPVSMNVDLSFLSCGKNTNTAQIATYFPVTEQNQFGISESGRLGYAW